VLPSCHTKISRPIARVQSKTRRWRASVAGGGSAISRSGVKRCGRGRFAEAFNVLKRRATAGGKPDLAVPANRHQEGLGDLGGG